MNSHRPDDAPFNWPPAPADLDRIDILDVANSAGRTPAPQSTAPVLERQPRRRGGKRSRRRTQSLSRMAARNGWLLLASGVLIGATLPGVVRVQTSGLGSTAVAAESGPVSSATAAASEGAALRAMQSLLRGGSGAAASPATSVPEPDPLVPRAAAAGIVAPQVQSQPIAISASTALTTPPATMPTGAAPGRSGTSNTARPMSGRTGFNAQEAPVRRVLQAYARAWTRMDAGAARALWPSADAEILQAAFRPVSEQRLRLSACQVGMSGNRALAVCLGTLRYRPRDGGSPARVQRGRWEFELARSPQGWQIDTIDRP
jgi:hypothetical protein